MRTQKCLAELHLAADLIQLQALVGEGIDLGTSCNDVENPPCGFLRQGGVCDQARQLTEGAHSRYQDHDDDCGNVYLHKAAGNEHVDAEDRHCEDHEDTCGRNSGSQGGDSTDSLLVFHVALQFRLVLLHKPTLQSKGGHRFYAVHSLGHDTTRVVAVDFAHVEPNTNGTDTQQRYEDKDAQAKPPAEIHGNADTNDCRETKVGSSSNVGLAAVWRRR